jgi:ligand-binding sensor domain-containing protein/signal transduction histidine kinase
MPKKSWAFRSAGLPLCLIALALSAVVGPVAGSNAPFIVDSWSAESGLPGSEVISIIQSRDGYLWLGTLHGLVRFDGIKFAVFNENNTPGLTSDRIIYLYEDHQTNLWIGTESSGLSLIHDGKVKSFDLGHAGQEGKLTSVCEDSTGTAWFYTADSHLARYQNGRMQSLSFNFPTPPICRMIAVEKSGELWVADVSGMFSIRPESFDPRAIVIGESVRAERLDFILASQGGGIWRLMNGRVQKWKSGGLEKDFGAYPWGNSVVKTACEDQDGNLIVGTLGAGIFWYDANGQCQNISTNQGLSSVYVLSLCLDHEGNLWAGTDGNGLNRIKRKTFDTPGQLHPWDAQSLSADNQGGLWAAFNAHGVSSWETNATQDFAVGQYSNAWTVLVDKQQRVWAGTLGEGLFQLQDGHFQPAPGAGTLGPEIFALFESRDGQLWAGTQNGLGNFDGQKWRLLTTRDGLSENAVRAVAEDAGGNLWVGTESRGLNFFKGGKFISRRAAESGLPGDDISCLYADEDGVLWVGTSGHGLARLQNGSWTRYATTSGLASDSISYLAEDESNCLWIGSNAGLMRIPKQSLNDFAGGKTNVISCRTYGKADGLPTRECSAGSQPAACRTPDGQLWFPTIKGLASVIPADLKPHLQPPSVMIESVLVDGREQKTNRLDSAWQPSVIIPPGGEELEIHYTALNLSAPELVRFKCWLEGHETSWSEASDERVARYPKLPPGDYHFHVEACNEDDVWSASDTAVLSITVQPQFWQTGWFRLAGVVFILGMVAAIVRNLSTQKLQRQLQSLQQRETLEKERARIARDLHDQLGANLTQVALLGEMAEADKDSPAEIESHAQQISQTARETTRSLDEIVWAVNPANDTLDGLVNYAGKYAQEYFALAGLRCRAELPAQLPAIPIPPEVRHNVFLAFKEAVHNVVKHAQATEARIRLCLESKKFILEIEDNGRGTGNQAAPQNRNGLRNMKKRMEDIHGEFFISGGANGGTVVRLTVPIGTK